MEKMRIESLEPLLDIHEEKTVVKMGFDQLDKCKMELDALGITVEVPRVIILNDKEYIREFLNDN